MRVIRTRYKLDWKNVVVDGDEIGLFYSLPGDCYQKFALLNVKSDPVALVGQLNMESLENYFELSDVASVTWHLHAGTVYRLAQWSSGKRIFSSLLMISNDAGVLKPSGFWKEEQDTHNSGIDFHYSG